MATEDTNYLQWFRGLAVSAIIALSGASINIYSTVNKNSDRLDKIERRLESFDLNGSRTVGILEVQVKSFDEDLKELKSSFQRLWERQDNLHNFIRNNPRLSPPRGELSPTFIPDEQELKERKNG